MFLSMTGRGPARSRRALAYLLAALLAPVVLLVPGVATPAVAWREHYLARNVRDGQGSGSGGPLLARERISTLTAEPIGAPDAPIGSAMPAPVQVTSATSYYDVEGADLQTLLASLRQRGPSDGHGTWAASTSWVFRWSYQPTLDPACRVRAARVNLDLAYTYPQWSPPENVAPSVATAWQGYLARVELHEHGHRDIAAAAAAELARTLEALPGQASCDALGTTARATAAELLARHAQTQRAYDHDTDHGATQGAILGQ